MTEKRQKRDKKLSVEELYQNKNFVPPKEKNLETIFEEPRKSKDGLPILTSVRKYRRYLHFDPTEGKIQKRKMKAKKCINKMKLNRLRTRSSSKTIQNEDISLYILETLGESSDSDMDVTHQESELISDEKNKKNTYSAEKVSKTSFARKKNGKIQSALETCNSASYVDSSQETSNSIPTSESQQSTKTGSLPEDPNEDLSFEKIAAPSEVKSPRSTCIVN